MKEDLVNFIRMAMHHYADIHGLKADNFAMSPECRGRSQVMRWEIIGTQLRYEFLEGKGLTWDGRERT
jgi:hypothetical protein